MHIKNLVINNFIKNQKVDLLNNNDMITIISKQNVSTPGIIARKIIFEKNTKYMISVDIKKQDNILVFFYSSNKEVYNVNSRQYLNDGKNTVELIVKDENIIDIGFLISCAKYGNTFDISNFACINMDDYAKNNGTLDTINFVCNSLDTCTKKNNDELLNNMNNIKIDMYSLTILNKEILDGIYENINKFNQIIKEYKNILFICGDYPGYGGAATNCDNLQKYYQTLGHNTFAFYYNFKNTTKYEKGENYLIGNLGEIDNIIFKPDLIILKSFVKLYLKKKYNCPIYYLIGGIFTNKLNNYYYKLDKKENDKYINISVLEQIKNSDYSFVNSSHTQEILEKHYGLKTSLFYSSFVPFINKEIKKDINFENRMYDYGLIMSDFNRQIKNVEESIDFLKNKKNVILIGENSTKYKKFGFECVDLVDKEQMEEYYKQIKYIVQDSYYESCSNVKIEGLMNGCKIGGSINNCEIEESINDYKIEESINDYKIKGLINDYKIEGLINDSKTEQDIDIVVISEDHWGFGGFGTRAYKFYNFLKSNRLPLKKLIYLQRDKKISEEMNNKYDFQYSIYVDKYYTTFEKLFYGKIDSKVTISDFNNLFKKYITKNTIVICLSPISLNLFSMLDITYNKLIYYNGCFYHKKLSEINYDVPIFENMNIFQIEPEPPHVIKLKDTMKKVDLFIHNSELSIKYLSYLTQKNVGELVLYPMLNNNEIKNNLSKKKFDLIYITSDINRKQKNTELVLKIFNEYPHLKKIIIGKNSSILKNENTECFEYLNNDTVHEYLTMSRITLIPSFMDLSPNVFFESISCFCTPLITINVGCSIINNNKYKYALNHDIMMWKKHIDELLNTNFDIEYFSSLCKHFKNCEHDVYKYIFDLCQNKNNIVKDIKSNNDEYCICISRCSNIHVYNYTKGFSIKTFIVNYYEEILNYSRTYKNIILINDDVLLYNWTSVKNRNNQIKLLLENINNDKYINAYNLCNTDEKLLIINSSKISNYTELMELYFLDNQLFYKNIYFTDIYLNNENYVGVKINNKMNKKSELGVLFLQQFKGNVFENYIKNLTDQITNVNIFIYYGHITTLDILDSKSNIIYVNEDNICDTILETNVKKLYIPYLPLEYFKNITNFNNLLNNNNIDISIFIGGIVSHMYKYVYNYNISKIITVGTKYDIILGEQYKKNINPIWHYQPIQEALKYKKTFKKMQKNFSIIGRISQEKNIIFFVKVFNEFIKITNDSEYKLYIIGNGCENIMHSIKNYVEINNLGDNIYFIDWLSREELYKFLIDNIDYNIICSTNEGLSGILLETMSMGIPCISSNVYCVNDVIINNYNGLMYEYENYEEIIKNNNNVADIVKKINQDEDVNINNLLQILLKVKDDSNLYKKLSSNCVNYIINYYQKKNFIDYHSIFGITKEKKMNDQPNELIIFCFDCNVHTINSCRSMSKNIIIINEKYNPKNHIELIKKNQTFKYIIILVDNINFITEYRCKDYEFYTKYILLELNELEIENTIGFYFPTQNLMFGSVHNLCIYNYEKFIDNIDLYNGCDKKFYQNTISNYNYRFSNKYIGFYIINNIYLEFKNIIENLKKNVFKNLEFIKELFKKYNIMNADDLLVFCKEKFNFSVTREFQEILFDNLKIVEIVNNNYSYSKFYYKYPKCNIPYYDIIAFSGILDINNKLIKYNIHTKKKFSYDVAFVYHHYISGNNFERKISYYMSKLKSVGIKSYLIIPYKNINSLNIIFNSYFEYENIIFISKWDEIEKYNIKTLCFIDTHLDIKNNLQLTNNLNTNNIIILSGYISALNKNLTDEQHKLKNIKKIISNCDAHAKILQGNYEVNIHKFWDIRKFDLVKEYKNKLNKKISYIGRYSSEKNVKLIFRVFLYLSEIYKDYSFNFYGCGNELNDEIDFLNKNKIDNLDICNKWLDSSEVLKEIKNSDFVVLASISEGNPSIIWESYKCGIPIISSNIWGCNNAVKNNVTGLLFDLGGYDNIKNNLYTDYKYMLNYLSDFNDVSKNNMIECLKKAIMYNINDYNKIQNNCFNEYEIYSNDKTCIRNLFM